MNFQLLLLIAIWPYVNSQNMSSYPARHRDNITLNETTTSLQSNNSSTAIQDINYLSLVEKVCISLFSGCVSSATVAGNILIIAAFVQDRKLQILNNYFLVSLAVADATIGAISMPFITMRIVQGYWSLGRHFCDVFLFVDYLTNAASVAHVFIICVDRYLVLSLPFRYNRQIRNKRTILLMITGAWISSFLISAPLVHGWSYTQNTQERPDTECYLVVLENSYFAVFSNVVVDIPTIIMVVLYYKILQIARKSAGFKKSLRKGTDKMRSSKPCFKNDVQFTSSNSCRPVLQSSIDRRDHQKEYVNETAIHVTEQSQHTSNDNESKQEDDLESRHASRIPSHQENRIFKIVGAILFMFIVTLMPINIASTIQPFCKHCISSVTWHFLSWFLALKSAANPYYYALCISDFKEAFKRILCWKQR